KKFDPVSKGWVNKNLGFRGSFVNHLSGDESVLFARADSSFFKSTDGGKNWDKYPLHSNLYSPVFQTSYYVLEDTIYISTQNAVLKAPVNNAIKWDTLAAFPNGSIVDFHLSENAFLLVVYPSPGLILLDPKLGVVTSVPYTFNSLYYYNQFNQMDGHLVFIAKHGDLWHSQDMGQTWTEPIMSLNPSAQHYQRLFKTDKRFYYNNNDKLFLSEDKGRSWIQLPANGLPKSIFNTRQVLQDLVQADSLLFAAIPGKGVFVSHDWGYNWQLYMDGLDENWVYALAWHKKQLFAGTFYNSVWRSNLELLSVGDAAGKDADLQFSPNPARDRIVIQWSDLKGGTLQMINARAQLVSEQKVADGLGILEVSVGNLPAGTYTMQLVRKGAILSGQAVIVR
ncbi:MAG: hypothetical protein KGS48_16000, partial [Bacteroidetes bacterium]|nr:hypothetical protein [Bacteroidota bacterium]